MSLPYWQEGGIILLSSLKAGGESLGHILVSYLKFFPLPLVRILGG